MEGPAGPVAFQVGHVQGFADDALPGESGIAVDEHREDALRAVCAVAVLAGAALSLDHRIDGFQVARVGHQGKVETAARREGDIG